METETQRAFVALGSNLDDPQQQIRTALANLHRMPSTRLVRASRLYRTPPWGYANQPEFINAVAELATRLDPAELLSAMHALEDRAGRRRDGPPNGPRNLDLDLILYGDRVGRYGAAVLPHPRLHERAFVLLPLAELAADLVVPGRGSIAELLASVAVEGCVALD